MNFCLGHHFLIIPQTFRPQVLFTLPLYPSRLWLPWGPVYGYEFFHFCLTNSSFNTEFIKSSVILTCFLLTSILIVSTCDRIDLTDFVFSDSKSLLFWIFSLMLCRSRFRFGFRSVHIFFRNFSCNSRLTNFSLYFSFIISPVYFSIQWKFDFY